MSILTQPITVLGCNDDFATPREDVPYWIRTRHPVLTGVQEAKAGNYRQLLDQRTGVRQRLTDAATMGVAVMWDRERAQTFGGAEDQPRQLGHGWERLVRGGDLLPRGVVWQDLTVTYRRHGVRRAVRLRLASAHRPPARDRHLWPDFDRALRSWAFLSPLPIVLTMDANERGGPNLPPKYDWTGIGIDGAVFTHRFKVRRHTALPLRTSDHHAQWIVLEP